MTEFQNLRQGELSITQYWEKLTQLLKYVPLYNQDECFHIQKFILGLKPQIGAEVDLHSPQSMDVAFEKAIKQE